MTQNLVAALKSILDHLSRAAPGERVWFGVGARLARVFPDCIVMAGTRASQSGLMLEAEIAGLPEGEAETYVQRLDAWHPWRRHERRLTPRIVHDSSEFCPEEDVRAFAASIGTAGSLARISGGFLLLVPAGADRTGFLSLHCGADQHRRLAPSTRLGMQLLMRPLARAFGETVASTTMLAPDYLFVDALPSPALVIDATGGIGRTNREADRLLDGAGPLRRTVTGRLQITTPAEQAGFEAELARRHLEWPGEAGDPLVLRGGDEASLLILRLAPWSGPRVTPRDSGSVFVTGRQLLVTVADLELHPKVADSALRRTFGLSAAECALLGHLAAGEKLKDIAEIREVSIHTVRNQLQALCQKLGVSRQTEAVALYLRIALGGLG